MLDDVRRQLGDDDFGFVTGYRHPHLSNCFAAALRSSPTSSGAASNGRTQRSREALLSETGMATPPLLATHMPAPAVSKRLHCVAV